MFGDEWQSPFLVIRLQARKKSTESCMGNEHLFSSTPPVCAFLAGLMYNVKSDLMVCKVGHIKI